MRLSVIIPVLNEAGLLVEFLDHVRQAAPTAEIIVVDGGSSDGTATLASSRANQVKITSAGRGRQMNAGAKIAQGEVLWFVHVDSGLPKDAVAAIDGALRDAEVMGGCFSLAVVPSRWVYRWRDRVGNVCVDLCGVALGDRAFFCRREAFLTAGGYHENPLFEDADFYRKLRRTGRTKRLSQVLRTSSRRYEAQGALRTCLFYGVIMLLYRLGLAPTTLAILVSKFRQKFDASIPPCPADSSERERSHCPSLHLKPNLQEL